MYCYNGIQIDLVWQLLQYLFANYNKLSNYFSRLPQLVFYNYIEILQLILNILLYFVL